MISTIIPVLHEAERISGLIGRLRAMPSSAPVEILVVDGAAEQDTLRAIDGGDVVGIPAERGRGRQMNAGASAARGQTLLFLHADTILPDSGFLDIEAVMAQARFVGGAFDLGIDSDHWFLKASERLGTVRSRVTRLPYGDQAIFVRKDCFEALGGYRTMPLMEDVDLMRRIKKSGGAISFIPKRVRTSARRWEKDGPFYGTFRNWALITLYFMGFPPERLEKFYR